MSCPHFVLKSELSYPNFQILTNLFILFITYVVLIEHKMISLLTVYEGFREQFADEEESFD